MKINLVYFISMVICTSVFVVSSSFAGNAPIKVIHFKPNVKVVKYEFRYGYDKVENPGNYTHVTYVKPTVPVSTGSTCNVYLEGSGVFYVSVKDFYDDGTESPYSEPIPINIIPGKVNLKIISR